MFPLSFLTGKDRCRDLFLTGAKSREAEHLGQKAVHGAHGAAQEKAAMLLLRITCKA